jgi:hypothetical protein
MVCYRQGDVLLVAVAGPPVGAVQPMLIRLFVP